MTAPLCIDCIREGITNYRKPVFRNGKPVPGARCATHHRARRLQTRDSAWERRLMAVYGITPEQYWAIYEYQGGKCYICERATGIKKKLSVDHCHETGYVRGLLCTPCNKNVLGHLRDDQAALQRAIDYLDYSPANRAGIFVIAPVENLTPNGNADGDSAA